MTSPETSPEAVPDPSSGSSSDPVPDPVLVPGPVRPSLRAIGAWLLIIGLAVALDGLVGGLAVVFVAAVLLAGLPTRVIGGLGVLALALAPVAFLVEGVPSASDVSPALVIRSLLPHHLTFVGLVLVSAFALIDLAPHLRSWASAERRAQDDGPPLGAALGAVVVGAVALGALLACRAVLAT
ncbi:MAG TPA: hypothetical protein VNQ33_00010 [Acidimicrobiales bacterium]|nr:hypothetical protein [Acidimicrobiales bacterium]